VWMVGIEERSVVAHAGGGVSGAREAIFALLSLVVLTHLLYGAILPFAFTHDDPVIFMHTASRTPWELVASPKAWRDYNSLNFFPEQLWSFKLDLTLFGLDPLALRERQLLGLTPVSYTHLRRRDPDRRRDRRRCPPLASSAPSRHGCRASERQCGACPRPGDGERGG